MTLGQQPLQPRVPGRRRLYDLVAAVCTPYQPSSCDA
jgi:hypothetical protein